MTNYTKNNDNNNNNDNKNSIIEKNIKRANCDKNNENQFEELQSKKIKFDDQYEILNDLKFGLENSIETKKTSQKTFTISSLNSQNTILLQTEKNEKRKIVNTSYYKINRESILQNKKKQYAE